MLGCCENSTVRTTFCVFLFTKFYFVGNPFGGAAGFDAEDIFKTFFGGQNGPFSGFRAAGMDFEDLQQAQQVNE